MSKVTNIESKPDTDSEGQPCVESTYDCLNCNEHWVGHAATEVDDDCPNEDCKTPCSPTQSVKVKGKPLRW